MKISFNNVFEIAKDAAITVTAIDHFPLVMSPIYQKLPLLKTGSRFLLPTAVVLAGSDGVLAAKRIINGEDDDQQFVDTIKCANATTMIMIGIAEFISLKRVSGFLYLIPVALAGIEVLAGMLIPKDAADVLPVSKVKPKKVVTTISNDNNVTEENPSDTGSDDEEMRIKMRELSIRLAVNKTFLEDSPLDDETKNVIIDGFIELYTDHPEQDPSFMIKSMDLHKTSKYSLPYADCIILMDDDYIDPTAYESRLLLAEYLVDRVNSLDELSGFRQMELAFGLSFVLCQQMMFQEHQEDIEEDFKWFQEDPESHQQFWDEVNAEIPLANIFSQSDE